MAWATGTPAGRRFGDRAPASGAVCAGIEDAVGIPGNNLGSGCGRLARAGRVQVRWHRGAWRVMMVGGWGIAVIAAVVLAFVVEATVKVD